MIYIGDKTQFYNAGLEEVLSSLYVCPVCRYEKDVIETFEDNVTGPMDWKDAICPVCFNTMDKK